MSFGKYPPEYWADPIMAGKVKLRDCPLCRSGLTFFVLKGPAFWRAQCGLCGAKGPAARCLYQSILAWNRIVG